MEKLAYLQSSEENDHRWLEGQKISIRKKIAAYTILFLHFMYFGKFHMVFGASTSVYNDAFAHYPTVDSANMSDSLQHRQCILNLLYK